MPPPIDEYVKCQEELFKFINNINCAPILIRLAWHDSGTYDKRITSWPECGGANGSIIYDPEISRGANAGLTKAHKYLERFKKKYPAVSWADLLQMASALAVQATGGPIIPMKYGRKDVSGEKDCPPETSRGTAANAGLPDAYPGDDKKFGCGASDPATHLRNIFHRMGFDDEGIVALSGAHTLGRAFNERSGTVPEGYGDAKASPYTKSECPVRFDGQEGVGMPGGRAWTKNWLTFDNSYFHFLKQAPDPNLIWFPTDEALHKDAKFKVFFDKFAESQSAFFEAYVRAHKQLSEQGSKFEPESFTIPVLSSKL